MRIVDGDPGASHRFSVLGSVMACRGPVFKLLGGAGDGAPSRPMTVRSFDTVYGRLHGSGIASVISVDNAQAGPVRAWTGSVSGTCSPAGRASSPAVENLTVRVPSPGGISFHVERERPVECGDLLGLAAADRIPRSRLPMSSSRSSRGERPGSGGWRGLVPILEAQDARGLRLPEPAGSGPPRACPRYAIPPSLPRRPWTTRVSREASSP